MIMIVTDDDDRDYNDVNDDVLISRDKIKNKVGNDNGVSSPIGQRSCWHRSVE